MLKTVKAERRHLGPILANLSKQNRGELAVAGLTLKDALVLAEEYLRHGVTTVGLLDGYPVVAFGVLHTGNTWFMATDAFWDLGLSGVRFARRFLQEHCDRPLHTLTLSPHPDVERWFKALGYEKVGEEGQAKWFKYTPKAPISQKNPHASPEVVAPETPQPAG